MCAGFFFYPSCCCCASQDWARPTASSPLQSQELRPQSQRKLWGSAAASCTAKQGAEAGAGVSPAACHREDNREADWLPLSRAIIKTQWVFIVFFPKELSKYRYNFFFFFPKTSHVMAPEVNIWMFTFFSFKLGLRISASSAPFHWCSQ